MSVALDDAPGTPLFDVLRDFDHRFQPIAPPLEADKAVAYQLPDGFRVDLPTTQRGVARGSPAEGAGRRRDAFAVHKLIVARRRGAASPKAGKDLCQAQTLIEALAEIDPFALREAHAEALGRGPAWRKALQEGANCFPKRHGRRWRKAPSAAGRGKNLPQAVGSARVAPS